jgi:hypothetical protein
MVFIAEHYSHCFPNLNCHVIAARYSSMAVTGPGHAVHIVGMVFVYIAAALVVIWLPHLNRFVLASAQQKITIWRPGDT